MPGALPPTSGYTYAIELSADEAIAAGAKSVTFSQSLPYYVENFIGFPVGGAVPVGYYDRTKAAWIPALNGRVIKITAINAGVATVDTVGSGALAALNLSVAERTQLAGLYAVGQELWRVPIPHFTPWDCNWPYGPPADAVAPDVPPPTTTDEMDDGTCGAGSIVECENQALGERVGVAGTPFMLNYRSTRVPGRNSARIGINLSGASLPPSVKRIELAVHVAGQTFTQSFAPQPNLQTTFVWNGLDAYGRPMQGATPVSFSIGYAYDAVYLTPAQLLTAFGAFGGSALSANRAAAEVTLTRWFASTIGSFDMRAIGLGGWTLSPHHVYDASKRVLYFGDGMRRTAERMANVLEAIPVLAEGPERVLVGPDGSVYASENFLGFPGLVRRLRPDGDESIVAGGGAPNGSTFLSTPSALALAPDGTLYIAETFAHRIRRISPTGVVSIAAGTGAQGFSGDGGLATAATLSEPSGLAVLPDGTLIISDSGNHRIRRVRTDGFINTIAGGTVTCALGLSCGDGAPATSAGVASPRGIAVGPDGSLYFVETFVNKVRRIRPDGIIETIAGGTQGFAGDGGPATAAQFRLPQDISVAPDGGIYIADTFNGSVRYIGTDGVIHTAAGSGAVLNLADVLGRPSTSVKLGKVTGVAVGADGKVYLADKDSARVLAIAPALPGLGSFDVVIPSRDGRLLYLFNAVGRHLRTLDARTGGVLIEFGYDASGRLAQLIEKTGGIDNVTTIAHDGSGHPTTITGPFGQQTTLAVDANGFLSGITNAAGDHVGLVSTADGLLTSLTDPRGKTSTFGYDADGRLATDADAGGGSQTLVRTPLANGFTVARTTGLARSASFKVEELPGRIVKRTVTGSDTSQSMSEQGLDSGASTSASLDGTTTSVQLAPDPRFGMAVPVPAAVAIALPGGPTYAAVVARTANPANPDDPLSFTALTEATTIAGRTTTNTYTAANRTEVTTTPSGRTRSLTTDALGRTVQVQASGFAPATMLYDTRGRLAGTTWGTGPDARTWTYGYNPQGFLASITDPIGRIAQFTRDAIGRVTTHTLPGGSAVSIGYDAAGNPTTLTPPGRPAHAFTYSNRNEPTLVTPPAVGGTGPTAFAYNTDRQLLSISRPDNRSVAFGYDAAGRLATRTFATNGNPTAIDNISYDSAQRVAAVAAASGVTTSYGYSGLLRTSETWSGLTAGSVGAAYDANLRMASQTVNGANAIAFGYDNDGLMTSAGALTIVRDPQHGMTTSTTLGVIGTTAQYNAFGELTSQAAAASGNPLYTAGYTRDLLGRVTQKSETVLGVTDAYVYNYDAAGQLLTVTKNGAAAESYGYDASGNRTSATIFGAGIAATDEAQDRVLTHGATSYAYTAAGELATRTTGGQTTTYQYDAAGNLASVAQPGTTIAYVTDGRDRRAGRRVNGTLVQSLLYDGKRRVIAELDGGGALVSRFVYAGSHVPAYLVKGGVAHRIVTDQLGSVRLVVNASTGAVAQRIDYDTFGRVTSDTNPGFQPFGFAGGLYDATTGLVRFGARDYEPASGRWTAKDPIGFAGNDANLYRYVRNDPVNAIDPSGLDTALDVGLGILAGAYDLFTMRVLAPSPHVDLTQLSDRTRYTVPTGKLVTDWANLINSFTDDEVVDTAGLAYNGAEACVGIVGTGVATGAGRALLAADELAVLQARNAARLAAARNGQVDFTALKRAADDRLIAAAAESQARGLGQRIADFFRSITSTGWRGGGGGSGIGTGGGH
jgi:RHS repeat-associated protein